MNDEMTTIQLDEIDLTDWTERGLPVLVYITPEEIAGEPVGDRAIFCPACYYSPMCRWPDYQFFDEGEEIWIPYRYDRVDLEEATGPIACDWCGAQLWPVPRR